MTTDVAPERLHVVVGSPWKDAVISFLEPGSPYRPWPTVPDVRRDDGVVVIFDCEPRLVLTDVGVVESDLDATIARLRSAPAVPVSRVGAGLDEVRGTYGFFEDDAAAALLSALDAHRFGSLPLDRFGDSSMAAALALLESDGACGGCREALNLRGDDARDQVAIWLAEAADEPVDWPAAPCRRCQSAMRDGGFATFLEYNFARHPVCPNCGGRRTQRAIYGMLANFDRIPPWQDTRGCVVMPEGWTCTLCGHRW
ncbi:hypothetical protein ABQE93_10760 [Mycolicibacterium sp. XJ662]